MDQRIIVCTGAGRGLGFSMAKRHLEAGDRVFALERDVTGELDALARDFNESLAVIACDVGSTQSVEAAGQRIREEARRVDILYNIAGIYRFGDRVGLSETDMDAFAAMYGVNAVGPLRVCKAALPLLGPGSVIINISSEAGSITNCYRKQEYAYCMSKAALNMGARILANELEGRDIRIMNLHPGWLRTDMGGADAMASPSSVPPDDSAAAIAKIALNIGKYPKDLMYMEWTGSPLPW